MPTSTAPAPNALNRTEAGKLSTAVARDELLDMIEADGNPVIYVHCKRRRIAFDLNVYRGRFPFVGFAYCNRNGYGATGTASLHTYSVKRREYVPTVFRLDRFGGYFHTEER